MRIAGGIIALIAGILGILAAYDTLRLAQLASAFDADSDGAFMAVGYAAILLSISVTTFAAIALGVKGKKWPAIGIIVSSILAIVFGGTLVAQVIFLAIIGGVLIFFDKSTRKSSENINDNLIHSPMSNDLQQGSKLPKILGGLGVGIVALVALIMLIPTSDINNPNNVSSKSETLAKQQGSSKSRQNILHVNHHSATIGNFEVQIDGVRFTNRVGSGFFEEQANDGELYVTGILTYKNIGNKPISAFETPDLHLIDSNGNRYDPNIGLSSSYATELDINQNVLSDINPGITHQDSSVFVVANSLFDPEIWNYEVVSGRQSAMFSISPTFQLDKEKTVEEPQQSVPVQPTNRATTDPLENDYSFLIDRTFSETSMDYVRSKLGPAPKIDGLTKAGIYNFDECRMLVKGDISVDFIEFSSVCDGTWNSLIPNWKDNQKFTGSTFGDLILYFRDFDIDGCLVSCGNTFDPEVSVSVAGSRADSFIQLNLISVQNNGLIFEAMDKIRAFAKDSGIDAYDLEELKGAEIKDVIYNALKDVPIDRIAMGSYELKTTNVNQTQRVQTQGNSAYELFGITSEGWCCVGVIGVESWDALNIRLAPDSDSNVISSLAYDQREIIVYDCKGKYDREGFFNQIESNQRVRGTWCLVGRNVSRAEQKNIGWVNAYYLMGRRP